MSTFPDLEGTPLAAPLPELDRPSIEVDIACAGFGPATGGFLTTLTHAWNDNPADPAFESRVAPGMPLQVICYERADTLSAGVSGVVTRAQGIRASFPDLELSEIPMAIEVREERVFYLLDPIGASRLRPLLVSFGEFLLRLGKGPWLKDNAFELPWTPAFLHKRGGLILSIGQFNQCVAEGLMSSGLVQIWPGTPVSAPIFEDNAVAGLRLCDQGVDKHGAPDDGFTPGMNVRAQLTVVGDGPVGAISNALNQNFGKKPKKSPDSKDSPDLKGHGFSRAETTHKMSGALAPEGVQTGESKSPEIAKHDYAMGMKFVIELPEGSELQPGTVWHTIGYPEPEIFGFLYVHPDRLASVGIFVPSWMGDPARTAYRYLQHYIQHPLLWRHLKDGTLRSWGAKSLDESGRAGEPQLCGDGYARIGENSGSTNMLTGSGVDEAWTTGVQLGEAVLELLHAGKSFTQENLSETYEKRRRASWVERGAREAEHARDGFHHGFVRGLMGMALTGLTGGKLSLRAKIPPAHKQIRRTRSFAAGNITMRRAAALALEDGRPLHDALMSARGWPEIPFDGRLLVTQQDALLMGGKVQAMPGFADHVVFRSKHLCIQCDVKTCIAMCSGQAITLGSDDTPTFEREKCIHCGGCHWNCAQSPDGIHGNIDFRAGAGGLHSAEN